MNTQIPCAVVLQRLRLRGFEIRSEEDACRLGPWIRFTPMLQTVMFALSTVTGSVHVLLALAALLAMGLVLGRHPFDWLYEGVIRPLEKSPALPVTPLRRRLVFALGIAWCLATAQAFATGHAGLGYVLGTLMTGSTGLLAFTHLCIPSLAMGWIAGRLRGLRRNGETRPRA